MTDDQILLSHGRDLLRTAADNGYLTHSAFLDLHQRSVLQSLAKEAGRDVRLFFYGGYPDAERTAALFLPAFFQAESPEAFFEAQPDDDPLTLLRIEKDPFSSLSHRDYLGALMGLSIKREMLGDIVLDKTGAFLVCFKTVAPFLLQNLKSAGLATLTMRETQMSELTAKEQKLETCFASVASLRLDTVLGAAFSLSRTAATEAIRAGLVYVNAVQSQKPDLRLKPGDRLVLRGKGKAVLLEERGTSKKGRVHIGIGRYL